ncbi:2-oxoglutarate dehydrogenase complex dihydrolipoyllysine-residue succinyltransferase [Aquirufa antheringensis]|uniref:2-oxoglutarate dehydrogenase complex dihydrolipoyllysine-residue succinyltransferase n=1 Tax=Aquirufa antheringensis TaxID=2516559 RepID=UPI001032D66A|nr:2-oxoglutarate dehydrogenase complex dihydrolipoyllysine-residue succinyltransferase [Aquirufa antheringensis]MCL9967776.1 2-oxoglutarate dehydrogenase complex dihydrolipoyllysine-residue succinyltransferase [Aquirufa antheringensis]MCZ2477128.1 2-oxoglutarate dehydrogenase complex dihydrolipoyllysine-residue succinyltransferase [Aquirufa antheringensis]TBH70514.1 2-oxoglutarate dehydrogenase complex dihydrolipoyllysine-residue succinyltransferase [Aquirufa antheringensis]
MAIEMKVPAVGESITEVTVATWNKKEGDHVKLDEVLCELESDKATFELPAEAEGVLHIVAKEGDVLPIGAIICTIEAGGATASVKVADAPVVAAVAAPAPAPVAAPAAGPTSVLEVKVPAVGESITEVTVSVWNKKTGDSVSLDEVLCELESDKATFELPAESAGVLEIVAESGTIVPIGGILARITVGGSVAVAAPAPAAAPSAPAAPASSVDATYAAGHPSPAAAKILDEKGISAASVAGSGVGGRITKEDAVAAVKPASASAPAASAPAAATSDRTRREKMSSLRKTVARRLVAVKNETAMLTTFNEVDMKPVMDLRGKYKDKFKEKHGVGLGFMSFFTKAVCVALKEFPSVNAKIDGDEIVFHDYCDISIAVSAPKGLVVPVIRSAENLSLAGIESEVVRLAGKARENKLSLEEMSGGTFTITNGGVFGSMLSTPIINAPQVAILGMHNIVERPVVVDGQIVIRPIMYLALSYDHRIIDGRESVSFLVRLKQLLEDPARLLLDI